jgi:Rps23 Pro-64 3,4-dihydroxylase Tpa1-like proline 4-hydroxylase
MARAKYILREPYLAPDVCRSLLQFTLDRESVFKDSTVIRAGVNPNYRRSRGLSEIGDFRPLIIDRLNEELPQICGALDIEPFPPGRIEAEVIASNDGDYFRAHVDSGLAFLRAISYVLYFFSEPQGFSGGTLRLYDMPDDPEHKPTRSEEFVEITPRQNTMVFFPSDLLHEVTTVLCPDQAVALR